MPAPRKPCRTLAYLSTANEAWLLSGQDGAWQHLPFLEPLYILTGPFPWHLHQVSWQTQLEPSGGSNAGQGGWQFTPPALKKEAAPRAPLCCIREVAGQALPPRAAAPVCDLALPTGHALEQMDTPGVHTRAGRCPQESWASMVHVCVKGCFCPNLQVF